MTAFISNTNTSRLIIIQPAILSPQVVTKIKKISKIKEWLTTYRVLSATYPVTKSKRLWPTPTTKVADQNAGLIGDKEDFQQDFGTLSQLKTKLFQELKGINRGIFGVPSSKKSDIEALVKLLESQNPIPDPSLNLDKSKAVNVIKFNARGLNLLNGKLTIEASFKIASKSRVDISYDNSTITPDQLMKVFRKNYNLLLAIFNPEGWLEITYVDEMMRIGRDDKGNIFILERSEEDSLN